MLKNINYISGTTLEDEFYKYLIFYSNFESITKILKKSHEVLFMAVTDELKRNISTTRMQKNAEELSEEEKTQLNELVYNVEHTLNINNLLSHIVEGKKFTDKELLALQLLQNTTENGGYNINMYKLISSIYVTPSSNRDTLLMVDNDSQKNIQNREKIKNRVNNERISKLKAQITLGIEMQKKIHTTIAIISGKNVNTNISQNIAKLICGNSWYIALDNSGNIVDEYHNEKTDKTGKEKSLYTQTLTELKSKPSSKLNLEQQQLSITLIEAATKEVTSNDKITASEVFNQIENTNTQNILINGGY